MTNDEFWDQAVLAALQSAGDNDESPEELVANIAKIADALVNERTKRKLK